MGNNSDIFSCNLRDVSDTDAFLFVSAYGKPGCRPLNSPEEQKRFAELMKRITDGGFVKKSWWLPSCFHFTEGPLRKSLWRVFLRSIGSARSHDLYLKRSVVEKTDGTWGYGPASWVGVLLDCNNRIPDEPGWTLLTSRYARNEPANARSAHVPAATSAPI